MDALPYATGGLYYRLSGRFSAAGVIKALVLGTLAAIPLGAAYAYIELYNPIVYVTFLLIGGTGFLLGWLIGKLLKSGQIRNVPVAMLIAACITIFSFLCCWELWLFAAWQRMGHFPLGLLDILLHPSLAWEMLTVFNENGIWTLKGSTPTGFVLAGFWAVEAAILLGMPLWLAWKALHETPFCEQCQKWCDRRPIINLNPGDKTTLRPQLEARDFAPLTALGQASPEAMHYWDLYFQGCADCDSTQTLGIDEINISLDKNGKPQTKKVTFLRQLLLTPDDIVTIATIAATLSAPPPPPAPPAPTESESPPDATA